jgi:hypothetical protein
VRADTPPRTFGEYPPVLYRAFKEREHAEHLVNNGLIRFGLLNYYAQLEDRCRSDPREGSGSVSAPGMVSKVSLTASGEIARLWDEPGPVHHSVTFTNAIYILSLRLC